MSEVTKPLELTVEQVFQDDHYIIPLYQRNYAWEEKEINQLIQDIWDFSSDDPKSNYYIGSLVVHKRKLEESNKIVYETIDGQQRLTTLNILLSVIKNEFEIEVPKNHYDRLKFDSRLKSTETLKLLFNRELDSNLPKNSTMTQAYAIMRKKLTERKSQLSSFVNFLLNKVMILRVEVPIDTDLNHYFEIMNNRGEQLEKHEVLKAKLLSYLKNDEESSFVFAMVWDACANMEKYMQLNFKKNYRNAVFLKDKAWDYIPEDFEELRGYIINERNEKSKNSKKTEEINILLLLTDNLSTVSLTSSGEEEDLENIVFNSVIGFPNFLLHVLRVHSQENIRLDDKALTLIFESYLNRQVDKVSFVKEFATALLKCRFLFDKYIIKREFKQDSDSWSLQALKITVNKKTDQYKPYYVKAIDNDLLNRRVLMLLSMFHVSFPQIIYKNWLSGVLNYLYAQPHSKIDGDDYAYYLEQLSDAFLFDRFGESEVDYYDIIFKNKCELVNNSIDQKLLHLGTDVQNFIFNRLDYLIWYSEVVEQENKFKIQNIESFEFAFRSSVEHYYPQNPKPGAVKIPVGKEYLNQFGNLCLISRSKNSELSNYSPLAKAEHYEQSSTIESLKQRLMMRKKENWDEQAIIEHQKEMIDLLITKIERE